MFNSDIREHFRDVWSEFDHDATGFIAVEDFNQFMFKLGEPLGWDNSYENNAFKQLSFINKMNFDTYYNYTKYAFVNVIENLVMF